MDLRKEAKKRGISKSRIDRAFGSNYQAAREHIKRSPAAFLDSRQNHKVVCFSEKYDSQLMWGHYCAGHNGVCVEYKFTAQEPIGRECLNRVRYSNERPTLNTIEMMKFASSGLLKRAGSPLPDEEKIHSIFLRSMLTISTDWDYEREWRYAEVSDGGSGYRPIPFLEASRILIGINVSPEIEKWLREQFSDNLEIVKLKLAPDAYSVTI